MEESDTTAHIAQLRVSTEGAYTTAHGGSVETRKDLYYLRSSLKHKQDGALGRSNSLSLLEDVERHQHEDGRDAHRMDSDALLLRPFEDRGKISEPELEVKPVLPHNRPSSIRIESGSVGGEQKSASVESQANNTNTAVQHIENATAAINLHDSNAATQPANAQQYDVNAALTVMNVDMANSETLDRQPGETDTDYAARASAQAPGGDKDGDPQSKREKVALKAKEIVTEGAEILNFNRKKSRIKEEPGRTVSGKTKSVAGAHRAFLAVARDHDSEKDSSPADEAGVKDVSNMRAGWDPSMDDEKMQTIVKYFVANKKSPNPADRKLILYELQPNGQGIAREHMLIIGCTLSVAGCVRCVYQSLRSMKRITFTKPFESGFHVKQSVGEGKKCSFLVRVVPMVLGDDKLIDLKNDPHFSSEFETVERMASLVNCSFRVDPQIEASEAKKPEYWDLVDFHRDLKRAMRRIDMNCIAGTITPHKYQQENASVLEQVKTYKSKHNKDTSGVDRFTQVHFNAAEIPPKMTGDKEMFPRSKSQPMGPPSNALVASIMGPLAGQSQNADAKEGREGKSSSSKSTGAAVTPSSANAAASPATSTSSAATATSIISPHHGPPKAAATALSDGPIVAASSKDDQKKHEAKKEGTKIDDAKVEDAKKENPKSDNLEKESKPMAPVPVPAPVPVDAARTLQTEPVSKAEAEPSAAASIAKPTSKIADASVDPTQVAEGTSSSAVVGDHSHSVPKQSRKALKKQSSREKLMSGKADADNINWAEVDSQEFF